MPLDPPDLANDPGRMPPDWADLIDRIGSEPYQAVEAVLHLTRAIVHGKFSVYSRFDLAHSRLKGRQGCLLPAGFSGTGQLQGRICYEEFITADQPIAAVADLDQTPYAASDPDVLRHRLKAYVGAPVQVAGTTIGSLAVYDDRRREFEAHQNLCVRLAARLIGLIAGRQRLHRQLQRRDRNDGLFSALSAKAISTRDDSFLDFCMQTIGSALSVDAVCILWYDPQHRSFRAYPRHWKAGALAPLDESVHDLNRLPVLHDIVEIQKPFCCTDADMISDPITRDFLRQNRIASFLLLPICNQRSVYGICALCLHGGSRQWEEDGLGTLMAIVGIIAQWKIGLAISRELDESQALIYQLFQLSPTSIYQVDFGAERFVKVNAEMCRATGYSEEELLSMKPADLLTPDSREMLGQRLAAMAAGQSLPPNVEFQIRKKNGDLEWGHFHTRHLRKGDHIWGANVVVHMITEQKKANEELAEYRRRLEALVEERTAELMQANQRLHEEVARRTETALELRLKSERLEELNTAMRVLLDKRNEDRLRSEENIRVNLVQLIEPFLDRLDHSGLNPAQQQLLDVIRMNLNEVIGSPMPELTAKYYIFSPGELQVANLIRKGRTTKDMARLLNVSPRTVESYRNSIRKKLGLKKKKINLKTYLSSKE